MRRWAACARQHPDHLRDHGSSARSRSPACRRSRASSARTRSSGAPSPARTRSRVLGVIGYVAAGLTALYMGRLSVMTFFGPSRRRPPRPGAPARVAGGHDGPADASWRSSRPWAAALPVPDDGRAGHRARARWSTRRSSRSALAVALALGGLALAWCSTSRSPALPERIATALGGLLPRWCATSTASTSSTTA